MTKCILVLLFMIACHLSCFSQPEVIDEPCITIVKPAVNDNSRKNYLVNLIKSQDDYHCRSRDVESGFAKKTDSLMKMTSLQEKQELFSDSSAILRFYLFPQILLENDSVGLDLLKNTVKNSTPLYSFCSCTYDEMPLNLQLLDYYYYFIWLKYYKRCGGTKGGLTVWYQQDKKIRYDPKKWKKKLDELEYLVRQSGNAHYLKNSGLALARVIH